jgi:SLT domain-containing protein
MEGVDLAASGVAAITNLAAGFTSDAAYAKLDTAYSQVRNKSESSLRSKFSAPFNVSATVNINAAYNWSNPTLPSVKYPTIPLKRANGGVFGYASGGIAPIGAYANSLGVLTGPHVGLVGEAGPEAIIPLSRGRRVRGLALWEQAGRMLGVRRHSDGAVVMPTAAAVSGSYDATIVTVPVTIDNVTFDVSIDAASAQDTESIVAILRDNVKNLTDEIAHSIAVSLQQVFANMPKTAEGAY